jgi:hypothetical protein
VDVVDVVQFASSCHRKTLSSLLLYVARIVRMHDQPPFASLSTPNNDLGEHTSNIAGGREHLSFWHSMAPTTWNPWGFQTIVRINFGL